MLGNLSIPGIIHFNNSNIIYYPNTKACDAQSQPHKLNAVGMVPKSIKT